MSPVLWFTVIFFSRTCDTVFESHRWLRSQVERNTCLPLCLHSSFSLSIICDTHFSAVVVGWFCLTSLWRTQRTARIHWARPLGSCDTRGDCTSYTGWRKHAGDSEAPGNGHKYADCISHCHVWPLSSSPPADLTLVS